METIEWSLFPSRRDAAAATTTTTDAPPCSTSSSMGLALDLAAYRRRRKSLTHSALDDLVRATTSASRPITALYVNPLILGAEAAQFVAQLLLHSKALTELVFHCPVDLLDSHPPGMDRSSIDQLLRVAASELTDKNERDGGSGLSSLRYFRSNVLPSDAESLSSFLRSATQLEELSLGADQSSITWDGDDRHRSLGTIRKHDTRAITEGLKSVSSLRSVVLRNWTGDGLPNLVAGLGGVAHVELELDVTAPLLAAVGKLVETNHYLRHLALRNTGSRDVDCGLLISSLRHNTSIQTMKLSRFALSRRCEPLGPSNVERNAALEDLSFLDGVIDAEALALPVRGLRRLSLQGCRLASDGMPRRSLLVHGSDAMVRRMVLQATSSSFRVWGSRASPDEVFFCRDIKTVEQLLDLVIANPGLVAVECIGAPKTLSDHNDKLDFYLRLNQAGRGRDLQRDLPMHLIPTLWARHSTRDVRNHNPSILRHLVQRLAPLALAAAEANLEADGSQ